MGQKKMILYVITQGAWGGVQHYIFDLTTNLVEDFDIMVAVGEPQGTHDLQDKLTRYTNIKTLQLKHLRRSIAPWHDILAVFELAKLYKTIKPDIVHLNSSKAGIIGSFAKLTGNYHTKLVYTVHGWVFNEPLPILIKLTYKWLEKITAKIKNKIIVLSPSDYETGRGIKIPVQKMITIPLGIKTPEKIMSQEEARKKISILFDHSNVGKIWIGTIANFYNTKGLDSLVEAARKLLNNTSKNNPHFFLIGDGPEKKKIEKLIKKYSLQKNIHLLGNIKNAAELLPAFNLFVLPSRKEGLPYTLLEALAHRVPIVATAVGGIPHLLANKKTGLLTKPDRPDLLAETIILALKQTINMQQYTSGLQYNLPKMVQATTSSYLELIIDQRS